MTQRVTIVGGGIIGLACAWELQRDGHQVVLLDAAPAAREASWAAAGMLAPHNEADGPGPLHELCATSLDHWPAWIERLEVSRADVDYRDSGSLIPIIDAHDGAEAMAKEAFLSSVGVESQRWLAEDLRVHEPTLAADEALWVPAAQVDPRRTTTILRERCASVGVDLRYECTVKNITDALVTTEAGDVIAGDVVVLASGAWTPDLVAVAGIDLVGEPVKGQMLLLADGGEPINHFVHCRHAYCVPRAGSGVVVGATMVCDGFDRSEDPVAIDKLVVGARLLFPHLMDAQIVETWTGLRPRLQGGLPCIERINDHLVLATGHFRNGILLTPITAELVADLVAERAPTMDCAPFAMAVAQR